MEVECTKRVRREYRKGVEANSDTVDERRRSRCSLVGKQLAQLLPAAAKPEVVARAALSTGSMSMTVPPTSMEVRSPLSLRGEDGCIGAEF